MCEHYYTANLNGSSNEPKDTPFNQKLVNLFKSSDYAQKTYSSYTFGMKTDSNMVDQIQQAHTEEQHCPDQYSSPHEPEVWLG